MHVPVKIAGIACDDNCLRRPARNTATNLPCAELQVLTAKPDVIVTSFEIDKSPGATVSIARMVTVDPHAIASLQNHRHVAQCASASPPAASQDQAVKPIAIMQLYETRLRSLRTWHAYSPRGCVPAQRATPLVDA